MCNGDIFLRKGKKKEKLRGGIQDTYVNTVKTEKQFSEIHMMEKRQQWRKEAAHEAVQSVQPLKHLFRLFTHSTREWFYCERSE